MDTEFYLSIEEPIRELVKELRDNGINTTCSCGHEMMIQADIIPDSFLQTMYTVVYNWLSENEIPIAFSIDISLQCLEGIQFSCYAEIRIGKEHILPGDSAEET